MRLAGVLLVLVMSRVAVLAGRELTWTWWSPIAYLWQDAAVVLAFAAVDRSLRRTPRTAWIVYAAFVAYVAVSVPITRVMSTPMTWPMWRAAGGALSDSMWYYVTPANLLCLCALLGAGAVAPWRLRRTPLRVIVAGCLALVLLGPAALRRVDTRGLDRNAWSALAVSALPRVMAACPERSRGACPERSRGACPERSRGVPVAVPVSACPERSRGVSVAVPVCGRQRETRQA
jgi:hypothetical protein